MNDLAIRFFWLATQATLVAAAAAVISAVFSRLRPRASTASAITGLAGLVLLALLSGIPMPSWWSVNGTFLHIRESHATAGDATFPPTDGEGSAATKSLGPGQNDSGPAGEGGWSVSRLRRFFGTLAPVVARTAGEHANAAALLVWGILAGVGLFVIRLGVGLCALGRIRQASRPLALPYLLSLLAALCREMDCTRPIEVREADHGNGPFTVGWRRPMILLPEHWRHWRPDELRAVLAHEVSHVCRNDYSFWVFARFTVALYFYHPLVHWLAGRLHLQQELAADALGAKHAGGRLAYLKALARLALRQEESLCTGPARAFLPARGTLMRRIAMLRREQRSAGRSWPGWLAVAVLGGLTVAASLVRTPARADEKVRPVVETKTTVESKQARLPFVYCSCPADAVGFYGFRPSVYFRDDPRMKDLAAEILSTLKSAGAVPPLPRIEEVEQVSGSIHMKVDPKAPKGRQNNIMFSLQVVRTSTEFDWKKTLEAVARNVTEVPLEGRVYYRIHYADFKNPLFCAVMGRISRDDPDTCFFQPDKHTLALGFEAQFRDMIKNGPASTPEWATAAGWQKVKRDAFACAITNHDQRFSKLWLAAPDEDVPPQVNAAIEKTQAAVFGMDCQQELRARLFARVNQNDAALVASAILVPVSQGLTSVRQLLEKSHERTDPRRLLEKNLLESIKVGIEKGSAGSDSVVVHAEAGARISFAELFDLMNDQCAYDRDGNPVHQGPKTKGK
jgi:beta-lactamase regulating signal transducer with metallopeptidase domain